MRKHLIKAGLGAAAVSSLLMVSAPAASAATSTLVTYKGITGYTAFPCLLPR
ncbi:hypothetical protein ACFWIY_15890 [Streptomyces sioyaensis]|uniref:hypothetical protein n=1 Tax=Streptomyces sioyaensis TaxID=67364 RepID=UPI003652C9F4